VEVGYTDGRGTMETVASTATLPVGNVNDAPTGAVTISGTASKNEVLRVNTSTLRDADGLGDFSYQWYTGAGESAMPITDANGETFALTAAQVGKTVSVKVSYTDGGNTVESVASAATAVVSNANTKPTGGVTFTNDTDPARGLANVWQGDLLQAANTLADADSPGVLPGALPVSYQVVRGQRGGRGGDRRGHGQQFPCGAGAGGQDPQRARQLLGQWSHH